MVCDVESDMFNRSLWALFRNRNYEGNGHKLGVTVLKLEELLAELEKTNNDHAGISRVIDDAIEYTRALLASTAQLRYLNQKLSRKAKALPYSMGDYNQDFREFKMLQNHYLILGDRLNTDYKLYAHQIALLDN